MKPVVIYKSKYGSTRQYAQWIAEELQADLLPLAAVTPTKLHAYDTIIFGSYIHIGKLMGASFLVDNWTILRAKSVIVFSVSGAKPGSADLQTYYEQSVPAYIRNRVTYFPLWGRVKHLDLADTLLMAMPTTALRIKLMFGGTEKDRLELRKYTSRFDHVDKQTIAPLIQTLHHTPHHLT